MSRSIIPTPAHQPGDTIHGFVIDRVTELPDIRALAYEATHADTGAQVLHVHCNDEENLFSVGFRTPPADSTGVAHILEHCVLAGSQKFPVKDAFNELGKRTLNTFLNAMTWPDRTVYPVCSAVKADYFNLATVYSDLVFNPLITRQTFEREGHHLEVTDEGGLTVSGVVYNEMKGVYSDPQKYIMRGLQQSLSPDTPYGVDSGGDPAAIPDLTYEQFVAFHRQFYSPSNARFLLYGDVALDENLAFLKGVLEPFDRVEVDSEIPDQPRWEAPRREVIDYPVGEEDPLEGRTFALLAWLVGQSADPDQTLLLEVLSFALYGSAAGPLRKALVDSGLGKDIFPGYGFDADLRQGAMNFGLRGAEEDQAEAIEALILSTLERIADEGLDPELIEASLHHVAFHTTEITPPFPLMVLYRANPPWYYGGDPRDGLQFSSAIARLRARYQEDPALFSRAIREHLLDNPHRLTLVARPSRTLVASWEETFASRMEALQARIDEEEKASIQANVEALNASQETPDSPEALATLPRLDLDAIPREVRPIPTAHRQAGEVEVFEHEVFSNGVAYLTLDFDIRDLDDADALLIPMLSSATLGMGAAGLDYEAMARRVARHTGGLSGSPDSGRDLHSGGRYERLSISGKVLGHNAAELVAILGDVLTAPDTSDHKRLGDLLKAAASRSASRIIPSGHSFAYMRAAACLDHPFWRREQWSGITQVIHLQEMAAGGGDAVAGLASEVARLQQRIFTRARVSARVAGDPELVARLRPLLDGLFERLAPGQPITPITPGAPSLSASTGVIIPGQVNYVGQVLRLPNLLDPAAPALEMLSQILSSEVLYAKLRVQGGAYGGFAFYTADGLLPMVSYRDPNLQETFDVYTRVLEHLDAVGLTDALVDDSRIGAIGSHSRVLSPSQQLSSARSRHLMGLTDEDRAAFRQGLFDVTAADIMERAVPLVREALATAPRAAIGGEQKLKAASEALGGMEIIRVPLG